MGRAGRVGAVLAIVLIGFGGIAMLFVAKHIARPAEGKPSLTANEWYARGNALLKDAKDLRGAAEAYRQAAELAPGMGEAHYGRGYALLELGDLDGAIPELESALSLAPENAAWRKDAQNALVRANLKKTHGGNL